jgi:hypothetical protein
MVNNIFVGEPVSYTYRARRDGDPAPLTPARAPARPAPAPPAPAPVAQPAPPTWYPVTYTHYPWQYGYPGYPVPAVSINQLARS